MKSQNDNLSLSPFEYIDAVSFSKKNIMEGTENDSLAENEYNPFLTNRMLSYHKDSILHTNEMNRLWDIPKKAQFLYYINILRPRKRFAKLSKKDNSEELEYIAKEYGCSRKRAYEYMRILSKEQIDFIVEKYKNRGEVKENGKNNRKLGGSKAKK